MYWLCLEHGTESTVLNNAFFSMKDENCEWLNKAKDLLWKIGLREQGAPFTRSNTLKKVCFLSTGWEYIGFTQAARNIDF